MYQLNSNHLIWTSINKYFLCYLKPDFYLPTKDRTISPLPGKEFGWGCEGSAVIARPGERGHQICINAYYPYFATLPIVF
jgi:hypothetical protein